MAFRRKVQYLLLEGIISSLMHVRFYSSKVDWTKLRPVILEKIKNRSIVPIAYDVLKARVLLTEGVSTLLKFFPIKSCTFCPEVYIGSIGHQIKTCRSFKHNVKHRVHQWTDGDLKDILVPTFHNTLKDDKRVDFRRVPAIVELCHQAGAKISMESSYHRSTTTQSSEELRSLAQTTLEAWETLRLGVQKLLQASPTLLCEYCQEVHMGPSEYKPRLREIFEHRGCEGYHRWKKAKVDDFVPPKMVWHRRPHDPVVLVDSGRDFYGRAPAVVELCVQAGARVPAKYCCMMKSLGLTVS